MNYCLELGRSLVPENGRWSAAAKESERKMPSYLALIASIDRNQHIVLSWLGKEVQIKAERISSVSYC